MFKCTFTTQECFQRERRGHDGDLFKGTNILQSFYYCNDHVEQVIMPQAKRFMLDSGAFTFFSAGGVVNWNSYIKQYAAFINRNKVKYYFELDIDKLIGYEKVLYYRAKLEDMTGVPCIPVWHKSRGKAEFVKMCEKYDYVSIGGIASKEITRKEYKYLPHFINTAHEHGAKIHGLGFTSVQGLRRFHFDSVDSTSWLSGGRFGMIFMFDEKTKQMQTIRGNGRRVADYKAATIHNFKEWVKFAQCAEKYF